MNRAIATVVALFILAGHNLTSAQAPVYRCPGPPVVYTDALTPAEAKVNGCLRIERRPTTICGLKNDKTGKIDNPCQGEALNWAAADAYLKEVPAPPEKKPTKLGPIDKWRFNSCMEDAAKAPTENGVRIGLKLCRDRFDQ